MASVIVNEQILEELLQTASLQQCFSFFESNAAAITDEQVRINSIAAPPFGEATRAEYLRQRFTELGLSDPQLDDEGNCVALRAGASADRLLVVSAHLDTVFPAETILTPKFSGSRIYAPGICDDASGLVALIAIAEAMHLHKVKTAGSLLFVGTVGEEGEGDLRGVRYLFSRGRWAKQITEFISFDGAGIDRITNGALGSRRYRVRFSGSGGHSWSDFGVANPINAAAMAVAKLAAYPVPTEPRTTFNAGKIEGGQSVNAIPREASIDVDLRSASATELTKLDAFFRRAVREAADEVNERRRGASDALKVITTLLGDRPSGETSADSPLVQLACAATEAVGVAPVLDLASTDSNVPISLGIPAVTLGAGGTAANLHTPDEWYDPENRSLALKRGMLVMLGTVGLAT